MMLLDMASVLILSALLPLRSMQARTRVLPTCDEALMTPLDSFRSEGCHVSFFLSTDRKNEAVLKVTPFVSIVSIYTEGRKLSVGSHIYILPYGTAATLCIPPTWHSVKIKCKEVN